MGTHPIFESDFDCLTDFVKMVKIVESQADFDAVINGNTLVCVDFFATWCECLQTSRVSKASLTLVFTSTSQKKHFKTQSCSLFLLYTVIFVQLSSYCHCFNSVYRCTYYLR